MKRCIDCDACRKGWFSSKPDKYVCIGVAEPFIIDDIYDKCKIYNDDNVKDNLYIDYRDDKMVVMRMVGCDIYVVKEIKGSAAYKLYYKLIKR